MRKMATFLAACVCLLSIAAVSAQAQWITNGVGVCTAAADQIEVLMASDGAGGAFIAWRDSRNGNLDVYVQRLDADGNALWTAGGVAVCTNVYDQWLTDIEPDGFGGAILVWEDARGGAPDLYAQRLGADGNSLWTLDGVILCTQNLYQQRGRILPDGTGGAIVVWADYRNSTWEVFAQRIAGNGSLQWTLGGVSICSVPVSYPLPEIISDGSGGAIITWQDARSGSTNYNIYAQKIGSSGAVEWAANGVAVCTAARNQLYPRIISCVTGGAIITWQDERISAGSFDIYAQRIDVTGAAMWTTNGLPICGVSGSQISPQIVTAAGTDAIICWQDARNGNNDIFAQSISSSGAARWAATGVGICTNAQNQQLGATVSDGTGGAIVAWMDDRGGTGDIYAQRIVSAGTLWWETDGAIVCVASGSQENPVLIGSGPGAAIVAWKDLRSGTSADVYVQSTTEGYYIVSPGAIDFGTVEVHSFKDSTFTIKNVGPGTLSGSIPEAYYHFSVISGGGPYSIDSGDSLVVTVRFEPKAWGPQTRTITTGTDCPSVICTGTGSLLPMKVAAWGNNQMGQRTIPEPNEDYVGISGGWEFSLGLKLDGTILGWGDNYDGQCTVAPPNSDFISMAGGFHHSLGLKSDGTIAAWGKNTSGECDVPAPNADFIAVSAGDGYSLGLKADGTIAAWGTNGYGQCDIPAPNADFVAVSAGGYHGLGLKSDGTIVAWGRSSNGQCNVPSPNAGFIAVAAGAFHSLGLKADGSIVGWGYNIDGECNVPSPNADFIAVSAGYYHSMGLKSDGTLRLWGWNASGQGAPPALNMDFVLISCGGYHNLGLREAWICDVWPTGIDIGTVFVDGYKDTTFVVRNIGYGTMGGSVSEPCSQFSIVSGGSYTIAPGDSHIVTVRFAPLIPDVDVCSIDPGTDCDDVVIQGYGQGPACSVAPDSLDFGSVTVGQHRDLEYIVTNVGGGRLTGSVTESCGYYAFVSGGGAYDLGHGDTLHVTVRFEPLATGVATCGIPSSGICGDVFCTGVGDRVPVIFAIRDVPGDQGGYLNVAWDAVPGDNPTEHAITRYTVWRAIEPTAAELAGIDPRSIVARISDIPADAKTGILRPAELASAKYYWKLISSVDAYYLEAYSEVVPTLFDSTAVCDEYHYVQIIAHSADPYVFWISPPDSGRSVDNLAPAPPLYLAGNQSFAPEGLTLTWAPNGEADLSGYAIYRGESEDFVPGPGNLVVSTPDTLYLDGEWRWSEGYYYKVSAVDVHGNESVPALLRPEEVTGEETSDTPHASYLSQNFPNPFNPTTKIEFGLASSGIVRLRIYDAAGRLVRSLADEAMPAGRHVKMWDGRDARGSAVSSGIYFYRLDAGAYTQTRKMVLLR